MLTRFALCTALGLMGAAQAQMVAPAGMGQPAFAGIAPGTVGTVWPVPAAGNTFTIVPAPPPAPGGSLIVQLFYPFAPLVAYPPIGGLPPLCPAPGPAGAVTPGFPFAILVVGVAPFPLAPVAVSIPGPPATGFVATNTVALSPAGCILIGDGISISW